MYFRKDFYESSFFSNYFGLGYSKSISEMRILYGRWSQEAQVGEWGREWKECDNWHIIQHPAGQLWETMQTTSQSSPAEKQITWLIFPPTPICHSLGAAFRPAPHWGQAEAIRGGNTGAHKWMPLACAECWEDVGRAHKTSATTPFYRRVLYFRDVLQSQLAQHFHLKIPWGRAYSYL